MASSRGSETRDLAVPWSPSVRLSMAARIDDIPSLVGSVLTSCGHGLKNAYFYKYYYRRDSYSLYRSLAFYGNVSTWMAR